LSKLRPDAAEAGGGGKRQALSYSGGDGGDRGERGGTFGRNLWLREGKSNDPFCLADEKREKEKGGHNL